MLYNTRLPRLNCLEKSLFKPRVVEIARILAKLVWSALHVWCRREPEFWQIGGCSTMMPLNAAGYKHQRQPQERERHGPMPFAFAGINTSGPRHSLYRFSRQMLRPEHLSKKMLSFYYDRT